MMNMTPPPAPAQSDDEEQEPKATQDGSPDPASPYGPNNEKLPEDLQNALKDIIRNLEKDDYVPRLEEVRRTKRCRLFWLGLQHLDWDETSEMWKTISASSSVGTMSADESNASPYQFVENIYRGYGRSFLATLTQAMSQPKFFPKHASNPEDQATADAADDVSDLIWRNNQMEDRADEAGYYLWNDGAIYAYVRSVTDAERFGETTQPVITQVEQPDPTTGMPVQVPQQTGTQTTPNGQEVIDFFGKLEVKVPTYARTLQDAAYLDLSIEVHRGKLKATYPSIADKLTSGMPGGLGDTDAQERLARTSVYTARNITAVGGRGFEELVTFKRVWLRPWAFEVHTDQAIADQLKQVFPKGCYVALAGEIYAESRAEKLDDHWTSCEVDPGDGQMRQGLGYDLISLQEQLNTLVNIQAETHEHGIPTTFYNPQAVDGDAWANNGNVPGLTMPSEPRPGLPIGHDVFTTDPASVSPQLIRTQEEIAGPRAQFLTGIFAALFGGDTGQDTASGYAMQRDQAMGRIGLVFRRFKRFLSRVMEMSVECFRATRTEDVEFSVIGDKEQLDSRIIHLDQLKGNFYAHPEINDDYPISWTQQKNVTMQLIQTGNPQLISLLTSTPESVEAFGKVIGLKIKMPGAEAKQHQTREIANLLQGQPQMIDPLTDDEATHVAVLKEWFESDEGQRQKLQNPQGWGMVRMHLQAHLQSMQLAQMQQQQAQMAAAPPQGQGGPPQQSGPPPQQSPVQ